MAHLILFSRRSGTPADSTDTTNRQLEEGTEVSEETTLGSQQSEKGGLNQKEVFS
jgi:hypothetical protein